MTGDAAADGGEVESYGPGSDLMISLFSISILLLGIVGAGQQFGRMGTVAELMTHEAEAAKTPRSMPDRALPRIPPADVVSRADFDDKQKEALGLKSELAKLRGEFAEQSSVLAERKRQLAEADAALKLAQERLVKSKAQQPQIPLDLARFSMPVQSLATYFGRPEALKVPLSVSARSHIAAKTKTYMAGANQIFIDTYMPPEVLAFAPEDLPPSGAIRAVYLLSMGLGQAYREALTRAGVPLVCITVNAGSFETSAEVRRNIMIAPGNASAAFDELVVYYRDMPQPEAGKARARVEIRLGTGRSTLCDPAILEWSLADL